MIRQCLILILFISFNVLSGVYDYDLIDRSKYPKIKNSNEIDMGRVRSQDGVGNCYAFSLAERFEHYCSQHEDCNINQNEISPLYIHSKKFNGIPVQSTGGYDGSFLRSVGHKPGLGLSLAKESCAPFEQLKMRIYEGNTYMEGEDFGISKLEEYYNKMKSDDCLKCNMSNYAIQIKEDIKGLKLDTKSIENIIKKIPNLNINEFIRDIVISEKCYNEENQVHIPPFIPRSMGSNRFNTVDELQEKVIELVNNNTPPDLFVCQPEKINDAWTCGAHAVIVQGYRERCNLSNECIMEFKLKNSWGQSWYNANNDGWVDAKKLLKTTLYDKTGENTYNKKRAYSNAISWIEPKDQTKYKKRKSNNKRQVSIKNKTELMESTLKDEQTQTNKIPESDFNKVFICKKGDDSTFTQGSLVAGFIDKGYQCDKM